MVFRGFSWFFKVFHGFSRFFKVFQGFSRVFRGFQRFLKDFQTFQWFPRFFQGFFRASHGFSKKKNKENVCHCLYHTSARIGHMVTHMYITYNPLPPIQGCSVKLCIHELLQADGSYPSEHHKPPTHLQFYCPIKSVELS